MDTTILVGKDFSKECEILVRELIKSKWKIKLAFWNINEASGKLKLYLGIPLLNNESVRELS